MPDLSSIMSNPLQHGISSVLAVAIWAYFFHMCVRRVQRLGVRDQEPPLWLYGVTFKTIRWFALVGLLYGSLFLPIEGDIFQHLIDRSIPLGLAMVDLLIVGGAILGLVTIYRRWRAKRDDVVYEPLTAKEMAVRVGAIGAIIVVIGGVIVALNNFMGVEALLGEGNKTESADLGAFFALLLTFTFFWIVPPIISDRLADKDEPTVWARATGLELFRWTLLGIAILGAVGILAVVPGPDAFFSYPMTYAQGTILPLAGGLIFGLFWVLPMRSLGIKANDGDQLARDLLSQVRFAGVVTWLLYRNRNRLRGKRFEPDEAKQLCSTCLRPINDITLYKDLKFDACPHCASFIPPIYTMLDYIKHQSARIMPTLEIDVDGSKKKKRRRTGGDEGMVQELIRALMLMAVSERGTDLHFIEVAEKFEVRCRTDGVLYTLVEFDKSMARPLISALKILCDLDITERRKPQDGAFKMKLADRQIDVRLNTSPVPGGEMAAARLLYLQDVLGSIKRLGLGERQMGVLAEMLDRPSGLILVTGPTGSGKSTTLYNSLQEIANGQRNIVTLEDPIEYQIQGLTQMQVNANKGFTFATGLRTILRQDPDVIMIGEIRDTETAKMSIDAAATGHLVFSTLHANDSTSVIGRLQDLGVDPRRLASVIVLVLAQRLMRLTCEHCATEYEITREELAEHGIMGAPEESYIFKRGAGCPRCHETGYYGREGVFEFFVPNDEVREMISEEASLAQVRKMARSMGMRTLLEDGLTKVLSGRTSLDELLRVTA